ncbi:MAG: hypothetical protein HWD60_14605 [Defluviicoccus sp.]|nr:MAG: hypothetical protein HWD60_14605 [Defluviicoccus sp.]
MQAGTSTARGGGAPVAFKGCRRIGHEAEAKSLEVRQFKQRVGAASLGGMIVEIACPLKVLLNSGALGKHPRQRLGRADVSIFCRLAEPACGFGGSIGTPMPDR